MTADGAPIALPCPFAPHSSNRLHRFARYRRFGDIPAIPVYAFVVCHDDQGELNFPGVPGLISG